MRALTELVRMDATPVQILFGLPEGFIQDYEESQGFEDRLMVIPDDSSFEYLAVRLSYDGESELIAVIEDNPYDYSMHMCSIVLRTRFSGPEDPDEDN